jgi:hypothetical protein
VCFLLKQINPEAMSLILEKGDEIKLSNESVHRTLGVRCEGTDIYIGSTLSEEVKHKIHEIFSTPSVDDLPTMEDAKKILLKDYGEEMTTEEEAKFAAVLAAFICGYMFGPPARAAEVPKNILEFVSNPKNLMNCNWASYILRMIMLSARKVRTNLGVASGVENKPHSLLLGGCWLYLEVWVFYLWL